MNNKPQKPAHLSDETASAFQDRSVVEAYQYRPQYVPETFEVLTKLMPNRSGRVLDVGCGTGFIARQLVHEVTQVDAVDISAEMIAHAERLENGDAPNIHWFVARAEDAAPQPPYTLITAGESLHWMDWETVMPHFARLLETTGVLALVSTMQEPLPWDGELRQIIAQYSTIQNFKPINLPTELERRGLFQPLGLKRTAPVKFRQSVENYIESFHGRASFSRERMRVENALSFDRAVRELVSAFVQETVELHVFSEIIWGKPLEGAPLTT
jgi:ubiquinone/menaquinone biosynthesis C-methylase UbiE